MAARCDCCKIMIFFWDIQLCWHGNSFCQSVYSLRETFRFSGAVPGNAWRLIPGLIAAFSCLGLPPASPPILLISPPCAPPSPCSTQSLLSALHTPLNLLSAPLYTLSLFSALYSLSTKILFLSFGGKFVHLQVNKSRCDACRHTNMYIDV